MSKKEESNCCGEDSPDEDVDPCACIPQPLEYQLTPCGTRLLAVDPERMYSPGRGDSDKWLSQNDYIEWSRSQGWEVDPIIWFARMGHWPLPEDVLPFIPRKTLEDLFKKHNQKCPV
jgi:hypothetical protein